MTRTVAALHGLAEMAQQPDIGLQGLRLAYHDAHKIRMARIQQVVALCRKHRAGDVQYGGLSTFPPGQPSGLQRVSGAEGAPVIGQIIGVDARFGQVGRELRRNQHVVRPQGIVLHHQFQQGQRLGFGGIDQGCRARCRHRYRCLVATAG